MKISDLFGNFNYSEIYFWITKFLNNITFSTFGARKSFSNNILTNNIIPEQKWLQDDFEIIFVTNNDSWIGDETICNNRYSKIHWNYYSQQIIIQKYIWKSYSRKHYSEMSLKTLFAKSIIRGALISSNLGPLGLFFYTTYIFCLTNS